MPELSRQLIKKLENTFLGFWVKQYKVSFLFIVLIFLMWASSLYTIPKDSSPKLDLGYISIVTPYIWVNPEDIDSLITEKIEREVKDIEWIKKITSSSTLWMSQITLELEIEADSKEVLDEVKDEVDKVTLPGWAEDTIITEISTEDNMIFKVMLYWPEEKFSHDYLLGLAADFKSALESSGWANKVIVDWSEDFEVKILVDRIKAEEKGISPAVIWQKIRSFNKNTPIWNYKIGNLSYDFRFDGEIKDIEELKQIPISSNGSSIIYLWDIAEVRIDYKNDDTIRFWEFQKTGHNWVIVTIERKPNESLFSSSLKAQDAIEKELLKPVYNGLQHEVFMDNADILRDNYVSLAKNMSVTLACVFMILLIFIGFKEGIISIIIIPLSYLITFFVLNSMGYALNFLTNFSLILSLWVAIDTIIVVIEWAHKKVNLGYTPRHAILLATREVAAPIISGTMTTLAAFLPMMFLPGVMWKYLAYVPITVFVTLLASLFLSLTVTSPIFMKLVKDQKFYKSNKAEEDILSEDKKALLVHDRANKVEKVGWDLSVRDNIFNKLGDWYYKKLSWFMEKRYRRWISIIAPFVLLMITFFTLSPKIWFTLFPASDNTMINITIESKDWEDEEYLETKIPSLEASLSSIPEIKNYNIKVSGNTLTSNVELFKKDYRDERGLRNSFEVEKEISSKISVYKQDWLRVESWVMEWGPPGGKAVWIQIIADSSKNLDELTSVSKDFEAFLRWIPGTKNVWTSSSGTPGQFVFKFDEDKLANLWISPSDIENEVYSRVNGSKAWTYKWEYDDYDIVVKFEDFDEAVSPSDIQNFVVSTPAGMIKISDVATYELTDAVSNIDREDTRISIKVQSDLEEWVVPTAVQPELIKFAEKYSFPDGITFKAGWETSENMDLIVSTFTAFFVALFIIFTILVLQFNSYGKPAIILYSVVLALLWVNIWLFLMWKPYSMPFGIWFIALTWIVINNAIIYIDKVNRNLEDGLQRKEAVLEAWKSRLTPMLVTTMTTIFWITPLWFEDEFWAWLAFTMVFWLVAWTIMTLFVIPSLYYQLFLYRLDKKDEEEQKRLIEEERLRQEMLQS